MKIQDNKKYPVPTHAETSDLDFSGANPQMTKSDILLEYASERGIKVTDLSDLLASNKDGDRYANDRSNYHGNGGTIYG